jgi:hypothetical protein
VELFRLTNPEEISSRFQAQIVGNERVETPAERYARPATRASRNYGKPSKIQNEKMQVMKINFLYLCPWWAKLCPFDSGKLTVAI